MPEPAKSVLYPKEGAKKALSKPPNVEKKRCGSRPRRTIRSNVKATQEGREEVQEEQEGDPSQSDEASAPGHMNHKLICECQNAPEPPPRPWES
ncbi:hypothetical protein NDU88_000088 [Pleurodeles waltl]|uniref:Uncharacterized protein n=1 Tax=Pleurodeles waltl TaxID=8319 RepID=A0AAV7KLH6_PLEWA|nr:hypothetical protein NDU88_000088 [Pleurodeles waltl]